MKEKNNIFIESEQKKAISENKPLEGAKFLRKEGELEIYLFPFHKYIIGHENSSKKEKSECLQISKQIADLFHFMPLLKFKGNKI